MVISSSISTRTRTISNKNNAIKGAILFGTTGAIVGAANSETIAETSTNEVAELIIRLKFKNKEPFEILTMDYKYNTANKEWRDILDQSKIADEFFRELLEEQ
jgi:cell shape-determining protein MreC